MIENTHTESSAINSSLDWLKNYTTIRNPNYILELDCSLTTREILELPQSIGRLVNLQKLNLHKAGICSLPDTIGKLKNLQELDLSQNPLQILPNSFSDLKKLVRLSLEQTELSQELPEEFGNLTGLVVLNLSSSNITGLPESFGNLRELVRLDLNHTRIKRLPCGFGRLENLTTLNLSNTDISDLPLDFSRLRNLSRLDLSFTNIKVFPPEIFELQNLIELHLAGTKITTLPKELRYLKNLRHLDLSGSSISDLPDELYSLPLETLDISNTKLETISPRILDMNLPFLTQEASRVYYYSNSRGIYIQKIEIAELDSSIFSRPREDLQVFFDEWERSKVSLNEARVIFVGNGLVGKSTMIHRIISGSYVEDLAETRGVHIEGWLTPENTLVKFWDFGGQSIMHSTHKFFLSQRCLYVVVLDGRQDEQPEYWLDLVSQYGRNCPVLVVMNKVDSNPHADIDRNKLQREYGTAFNWLRFCRISCRATDVGDTFSTFEQLLLSGIETLEAKTKTFPRTWYDVRGKLLCMEKNYITEKEYYSYCQDSGIYNEYAKDILLSWMNDLGICFSYHGNVGLLDDVKVLRPEWVLNGVYKIIMAPEADGRNGFLPHRIIKDIMEREDDVNSKYHNSERDFILEMMRKFKLSYAINQTEFIPMLSAATEPDLPQIKGTSVLELEFERVPSEAVLYQFIVEMRTDVDTRFTWRHGVYLRGNNGEEAIIRFESSRRKVTFQATHGNEYLAHIRNTFLHLLTGVNSEYREFLYYPINGKMAKLDLGRQLKMLRMGKTFDFADDVGEDIDICNVLACIVPLEVIHALKQRNVAEISRDSIQYEKDILFCLSDIKNQISGICVQAEMTVEQMYSIYSLCQDIAKRSAYRDDSNLNSMLQELIDELHQSNQKGFKEKFVQFIGNANNIASLLCNASTIMITLAEIIKALNIAT